MTIKNLYPTSRPSLDLNFANTKRLDPRITFSRASSGTYFDGDGVLKSAATNTARFDHNPTTGESLGLLVEGSRTNLLTYSEQFDNAAWSKTAATVTANSTASPDSTTTADTLTKTGSTGFTEQGSITVSSGASYTYSVYAKADSMTWMAIRTVTGFTDDYFYFNLSTGALGQSATGGTLAIQKLANGWYRCSVTATTTATTCGVRIYGATADENPGGTGTIFIWGAQLEAGSFPTSYIPTTTATVTRSADVVQITGTNFSSWYNQSAGSFLANAQCYQSGDGIDKFIFHAHGASTTNNRLQVYLSTIGNPTLFARNSGVTVANLTVNQIPGSSKFAVSAAYESSNFGISANGLTSVTGGTGSPDPALTTLSLGAFNSASSQLNGRIARLTYWPTRLSNATLQTITT